MKKKIHWFIDQFRTTKGLIFWLILTIVTLATAPVFLFEPYDWFQRGISEQINQRAYQGEGVIIAVNRDTVAQMPGNQWTQASLGKLIQKLDEAGAKRIVIDSQNFNNYSPEGDDSLRTVISNLPHKPIWLVHPPGTGTTLVETDKLDTNSFQNYGNFPPEGLLDLVVETSLDYRLSPVGIPVNMPENVEWRQKTYPALPQFLTGEIQENENIRQILKPVVDTSYDVDTVPIINAISIINNSFTDDEIARKTAYVSHLNGSVDTFSNDKVPNIVIAVLATQTLIDGLQYNWNVWPTLMIAILAGLAWTILPRPKGRIVASLSFIIIVTVPIIFERFAIYQLTSQAVFYMLIFALGRLAMRLIDALEAYRSIAETKSRFLAQASHDLRQPIHAAGLLAERLQQTDLTTDQKDLVTKILQSTQNASNMFKSLLDIAILESGTLTPKLSAVPVNDLLAEIDNLNAMQASLAGVKLRFVPSEAIIHTDRSLALTMLQNIVSNAIKYGGGNDIVIGCRRKDNRIALCVYDRGGGIAKEEMKLVSDEFYRVRRFGNSGPDGAGLGLSIVRGLANLLNVKFKIESDAGKGTAAQIIGFSIERMSLPSQELDGLDSEGALIGKKVLAIDDDAETLQSTSKLLALWGCVVESAKCFPDYDVTHFDIILSDYDFGDGHTLEDHKSQIQMFREQDGCFVILSGHHSIHIEQSMEMEELAILAKPLRAIELRSAIIKELQS